MLAIVACCAILAVWKKRPVLHSLLLTVSGIGWAVVLNIARVITITVLLDQLKWDLTSGLLHELLGLMLFVGTLYLTDCTDRLLLWFLGPVVASDSKWSCTWNFITGLHQVMPTSLADEWQEPQLPAEDETLVTSKQAVTVHELKTEVTTRHPLRSSPWIVACCLLFIPIGFFQSKLIVDRFSNSHINQQKRLRQLDDAVLDRMTNLQRDALPEEWIFGSLQSFRQESRSKLMLLGTRSNVWTYANDSGASILAVDFSFEAWHELTICYRRIGWSMVSRRVVRILENELPVVEAEFVRDDGARGLLIFGLIDADGVGVEPFEASIFKMWRHRLSQDWRKQRRGLYQVQLWIPERMDVLEAIVRPLLKVTRVSSP